MKIISSRINRQHFTSDLYKSRQGLVAGHQFSNRLEIDWEFERKSWPDLSTTFLAMSFLAKLNGLQFNFDKFKVNQETRLFRNEYIFVELFRKINIKPFEIPLACLKRPFEPSPL